MRTKTQVLNFVGLLTLMVGATGCTGFNHFASTVDMKVSRLAEKSTPEYEGQLDSIQRIGALTSIKFANGGPMFDVVEAPVGLLRGDVVRIYKTRKGYAAHLWHRPDATAVSENLHPHLPNSGS